MLGQILVIIVLILAWLGLRSVLRQLREQRERAAVADEQSQRRGRGRDRVEAMVRCEHCGVYVPRNEAVEDAGRWYCSDGHRDAARWEG
ncbi:PP0621 family protein [Alkalilimnicola ehrlichii MLHE-1]|uniref:MYND finger n=1 Tax=Alkalilimnicola ehrlichii (strain ATCC BAA-1101 / DSM 17681 / MLHE-1) TaxID=187272 RepID=Q0A5K1_ALKEH|nr:PP0621 family protein [Alkalilimnicola ehrlichii]ABI57886.1 hypothetical protein Mlg_2546 [Alkalilimnicola ehrlichii MLHE-1]